MDSFEAGPLGAKSVEAKSESEQFQDIERKSLNTVGLDRPRANKFRNFMIAMTASMMIMAPACSAEQKNKGEIDTSRKKIELKSSQEKEKVLVMEFLRSVKNMPPSKDPQQLLMMKQAIRDNLNILALKIRIGEQGQSGAVSPEDRRRAEEIISANISEFSDVEFGNNTEKSNIQAYDAMRKNPGMKMLMGILIENAR
jgi:hypothetical protein